jgi:hypothetical protein
MQINYEMILSESEQGRVGQAKCDYIRLLWNYYGYGIAIE